jgi:hypothetical protein
MKNLLIGILIAVIITATLATVYSERIISGKAPLPSPTILEPKKH